MWARWRAAMREAELPVDVGPETIAVLGLADARWAPIEYRPAETIHKPDPLFPRVDSGS